MTAKQQKYAAKHKHAKVEDFAAQRAVNAKDYLVTEQGIDASRISVATGTTDGQTVENYLVPAGATFSSDVTGTTPVDETAVKPQVRKPLARASPEEEGCRSAVSRAVRFSRITKRRALPAGAGARRNLNPPAMNSRLPGEPTGQPLRFLGPILSILDIDAMGVVCLDEPLAGLSQIRAGLEFRPRSCSF